MNNLIHPFLGPRAHPITRRFFYWIPKKGEPIQIVHRLESHVMDHLPGEKKVYFRWQNMQQHLEDALKASKIIAMEYSPMGVNPYVSKVDAGTIEYLKTLGVDIVSSSGFLQEFSCVLSKKQLDLHLEAANFLDQLIGDAYSHIQEKMTKKEMLDEYGLQQWILSRMLEKGYETEGSPIVSVNKNTAIPHYCPPKQNSSVIKKGDFLLLDVWAKKNAPEAVFADITRVACIGVAPTHKQIEVFKAVRDAQKAGVAFIKNRLENKEIVKGFEVDEICRDLIKERGYGDFFFHRTGHNLYVHNHGPGANLDSVEILDERPLLANTCFTIEPGIYLEGDFGVRLEHDAFFTEDGSLKITGGVQDEIKVL